MASGQLTDLFLDGDCTDRFDPVRAALVENFAGRDEIGSAVCVYHQGRKVVDLWGGHMDAARSRPWQVNTLCLMYSIAKSICALSVHILADEGNVDLEAPVATYWPEFAQAAAVALMDAHVGSVEERALLKDVAPPAEDLDAILSRHAAEFADDRDIVELPPRRKGALR